MRALYAGTPKDLTGINWCRNHQLHCTGVFSPRPCHGSSLDLPGPTTYIALSSFSGTGRLGCPAFGLSRASGGGRKHLTCRHTGWSKRTGHGMAYLGSRRRRRRRKRRRPMHGMYACIHDKDDGGLAQAARVCRRSMTQTACMTGGVGMQPARGFQLKT